MVFLIFVILSAARDLHLAANYKSLAALMMTIHKATSATLNTACVVTGLRPVQVYSVRWLPVGITILEFL